jgi:hypothetical protein
LVSLRVVDAAHGRDRRAQAQRHALLDEAALEALRPRAPP